jgi:hypothetical protein
MIERKCETGDRASTALYSDCELYRYGLTRIWDAGGRKLLYIMLNPSRATEEQNDPTIERCERRAVALGYGGFRVCNLFGLRETDPAKLKLHEAPEGPDNDLVLIDACLWADDILCAWGVHGVHRDRASRVEAMLRATKEPLFSLGLTRHGHPRHPLYVSYSVRPQPWTAGSA